ncbi:MAG: PKD domain-containing protein, partial [Bacteroidetes bacterium]|nr:PKD domain-containing protein [Bacteroidota bacterium]
MLFPAVMAALMSTSGFSQLNADFEADTLQGCSPVIVSFKNTSTGNFNSWQWDLGNNSTSPYYNVQAIYTEPGEYTVTLTITNGTVTDSATQTVTVFADPQAGFSMDDTAGCNPFTAVFQDATVTDPQFGGAISNWHWTFGDGTSGTAQNPSHTYNTNGTYTVVL